ncbi:E3 ubiquitin-protein ligase TRIM39-like isoform X1 [Erythrolamprus reginae]|uniref:E3 ubiquitin-protein ligase TRIM39-like isoform X1 n=1 Tax=Erythrolamprus reginae TaxID=121349 RepID=UPI00396C567D
MASEAPLRDLVEEASCFICLEYFQDPVFIPECGHNFCRGCLTRSWETSESEASCPQCRQTFAPRSVLTNRQLARMVEVAKRCGSSGGEEGGSFCPKHREPLKLFCKDHETLICVVCIVSEEHKGHSVIPPEEAFPKYKIKAVDCLKVQKAQKEKISTYKTDTKQTVQEILDKMKEVKKDLMAEFRELQLLLEAQEQRLLTRMEEMEKDLMAREEKGLAKHMEELCSLDHLIQQIEEKHQEPASKLLQDKMKEVKKDLMAEFRELQLLLEAQEKLLLTRMEEMEKDLMARAEKGLVKHMEELCSLDHLIQEIEEKLQEPASKLLQDIGSILKKYQAKETYENPVDLLLEPKWAIWDYSHDLALLKRAKEKLRDTLETGLLLQEENVTLDPGTADPNSLEISGDRKSILNFLLGRAVYPPSCPYPQRYEYNPFVLGCQMFSTGRHFWEVILGDGTGWGVGVAKKPENVPNVYRPTSYWQIGEWKQKWKYIAKSPSQWSTLVLTERPTRIRVSLNCEGGQVSFFDARTLTLLHTFSDPSLVGETLRPCFCFAKNSRMTLP